MNPATKLALACLMLLALGLALIVASLWPHYRVAAGMIGGVLAIGAPVMFAAIWRAR